MIYTLILILFGLLPLGLMWFIKPAIVRRHKGSLAVIVILVAAVSVPWELISIGRIWYYAPISILGPRLLNVPIEELAFYVIDALLVGTLALWLSPKKES